MMITLEGYDTHHTCSLGNTTVAIVTDALDHYSVIRVERTATGERTKWFPAQDRRNSVDVLAKVWLDLCLSQKVQTQVVQ